MGTTYAEKLKDPRWQKKRLEILNRDEWKCQNCSASEKTLHVHHKDYERGRDPWDYTDNWLATLCEDCHAAEPGYRDACLDGITSVLRSKWLGHELEQIFYVLALLSLRPASALGMSVPDEHQAELKSIARKLTTDFNEAIARFKAVTEAIEGKST